MAELPENPFCVPGRTFDEPGPLTPWQERAHGNYYADVDHTEQAYQQFVLKLKNWNIASNGGVALVHGDDGCGKTSLIHRCAKAIKDQSKEPHTIEIVDRSRERLEGETALRKCEEVVLALIRQLRRTAGFLAKESIQKLSEPPNRAEESDLRRAIEEVADVLAESKRTLIVVPSKMELALEIQTYVSVFARAGLVLLMETSEESLKQFIDKWNQEPSKRKILNLEVGPLEIEHGWTFVQSRVRQGLPTNSLPEFDESAVTKYMRIRSEHARVSVRELERVCLKLFDDAIRESRARIEYADFAELWVRYGGAIR